jgi:hypothetical protein
MKSAVIFALTLSSAAATHIAGHNHEKLRHAKPLESLHGKKLRFSKVNLEHCDKSIDPSVSLEVQWDPAMKDMSRTSYVVKCDDPRKHPETHEVIESTREKGPKNAMQCRNNWTILKGGFSVACQWDKSQERCRGYGKKEESCHRRYQTIDDAVFAEKLAELPKGYFEAAKMGNACNGGELNENKFFVMHGENKKVQIEDDMVTVA